MEDLKIIFKMVKMDNFKELVAFTICTKVTKSKWAKMKVNCKIKNRNKQKMRRRVKYFEWIMFHLSSSMKILNRKVLMLIEAMKLVSHTKF